MKKMIFLIALSMFIFTGCSDDPVAEPVIEFDVLQTYMADSDMDLSTILDGWVKPASFFVDVDDNGDMDVTDYSVDGYYVIDVRGADDFALGHIKGAHNVAFADIITEAGNANGLPILAVCYTGQSAARATALLRLSGFTTAKNLKWGMAGWNEAFVAKWDANASDGTGIPEAWLETDSDWVAHVENDFDYPELTTGVESGAGILSARINAALSLSWKGSATTEDQDGVTDAPANYFINNYWSEDSYNTYGHIEGAYRIKEDLNLDGLKYLDKAEESLITYCYTGQTSAAITAWLQVLGYENARSLLYGANGIYGETIPAKSWRGQSSGSASGYGYYTGVGGNDDEDNYVAP